MATAPIPDSTQGRLGGGMRKFWTRLAAAAALLAGLFLLAVMVAPLKTGGDGCSTGLLSITGIGLIVVNLKAALPWPLRQDKSGAYRLRLLALRADSVAVPALCIISCWQVFAGSPATSLTRLMIYALTVGLSMMGAAVLLRHKLEARQKRP